MSDPKLVGALVDYGKAFPYPFSDAQDRAFRATRERDQAARERVDFEHLQTMAGKAFRGVYGEAAKGVAADWSRLYAIRSDQIDGLGFQHKPALEALRVALRKVPERSSG